MDNALCGIFQANTEFTAPLSDPPIKKNVKKVVVIRKVVKKVAKTDGLTTIDENVDAIP